MARILFLAHRIPYPPNKGDKIRSWHFLQHLAEQNEVWLGYYVDSTKDMEHVPFLENVASKTAFQKIGKIRKFWGAIKGLLTGKPLTLAIYPRARLKRFVRKAFEERLDAVFLFSAATAPLLEGMPDDVPIITDLVDVDSAKWVAYAEQVAFPLSYIYAREAHKLAKFEQDLARNSALTTFVSQDEAKLFQASLTPAARKKVNFINNGVDLAVFDPERCRNTVLKETVLFTGVMDYGPNIEAAEWFVKNVWPVVHKELPKATFMIAGAPVHSRVAALADIAGVTVTGFVEDMAELISCASVVVAPLQTARGVQNKVLEGMAMGKPVLATSGAKEGIQASVGKHLLVEDQAEAFAKALLMLLANQARADEIGKNARQLISKHYTWAESQRKLDQLISSVTAEEGIN